MTERDIEVGEIEDPVQKLRKEWEAYKQERNERLRRFFVRVLVIFAFLGATVSVTAFFTWKTAQESKEGLCAIRHDSERRVALGDQFLKENPNGIPGISVDSLRRSINNAKETVKSLASLDCDPPPKTSEPTPTLTPFVTPKESATP